MQTITILCLGTSIAESSKVEIRPNLSMSKRVFQIRLSLTKIQEPPWVRIDLQNLLPRIKLGKKMWSRKSSWSQCSVKQSMSTSFNIEFRSISNSLTLFRRDCTFWWKMERVPEDTLRKPVSRLEFWTQSFGAENCDLFNKPVSAELLDTPFCCQDFSIWLGSSLP